MSETIIYVCVIVFFIVFWLLFKIYKKGLRQTALDLILYAEQNFNGDGKEKMKVVVGGMIAKFVAPIFPLNLIPQSVIENIVEKFVQNIFDEIKAILNYRGE